MCEVIKPIETVYNGYRFRSRLEARWAVFFDALHIKYIYEPEGFKLSNGMLYLPDFYLPELEYYVEVKGFNDHLNEDMRKVEIFVRQAKTNVIILSNIPYEMGCNGLYWFPTLHYTSKQMNRHLDKHYAFFWKPSEDCDCSINDYFAICRGSYFYFMRSRKGHGERTPETPITTSYKSIQAIPGSEMDDDDNPIKDGFKDLLIPVEKALLKARQARFEYGETPTV